MRILNISVIFIFLSTITSASYAENVTHEIYKSEKWESIKTPVVNFLRLVYSYSNTAIRETKNLQYQTRDEFDQLIYDVRKQHNDNRIDK